MAYFKHQTAIVGPGCVISDGSVIREGAIIGAGSTIRPGVTVGQNCVIAAQTVVTRDLPANSIALGDPCRIVESTAPVEPSLPGLRPLPLLQDSRGALSFAEIGNHIPFPVKRLFLVFQVPPGRIRGDHAHREQHQFLVCVHGRCTALADDGRERREFVLDSPSLGLYLPPMTWGGQFDHSPGAVLLVLTSGEYQASEYVTDYAEFLALKKASSSPR